MSYTFKDDGSAMTYYREYNKEVGTGDKTLVGNWVEERALRDEIRTGRYQLWANPDPDPKATQKSFTKFTTRPDALDSYYRTIVHSDHVPAYEFTTSNQATGPGYAVYKNPEKGVRTSLLEQRAHELAKASAPTPEFMPAQYLSTTKEDFTVKDLPPGEELGRRVMMTQNMEDIKGAGDGVWRKEKNIIPQHTILHAGPKVPMSGEQMTKDASANSSFKPSSSFARNSDFTTPIYECLKFGKERGIPTDKYYKPE
ncbi:hypothetical protein AB1Y20_010535 [Prymnesium parvum]|uniref:Flagellar associated protein n=1 Tax=Prymnesium parvum TaxID=97485 RepID=A0AB34IPT2_PRYPA